MTDFLFYVFAVLTLLAGLKMVLSRNAIDAAMSLILCLLSIAGLFVLLSVFLLAALQVLVYAGAIVVLFLFIIMLLQNGEQVDQTLTKHRHRAIFRFIPALLSLLVLGTGVYMLFGPEGYNNQAPSLNPDYTPTAAQAKNFGHELFTRYLLPVQVAGFLLLTAVVGILTLSKDKAEAPPETE